MSQLIITVQAGSHVTRAVKEYIESEQMVVFNLYTVGQCQYRGAVYAEVSVGYQIQ